MSEVTLNGLFVNNLVTIVKKKDVEVEKMSIFFIPGPRNSLENAR